VVDEVCRGIEPLIQLRRGHLCGLSEEAPEESIHDAGEGGDIDTGAGAGMLLEELEESRRARRGPGVNLFLLARERGIGKDRFLPGAIGAEVAQVVGKGAGEQLA